MLCINCAGNQNSKTRGINNQQEEYIQNKGKELVGVWSLCVSDLRDEATQIMNQTIAQIGGWVGGWGWRCGIDSPEVWNLYTSYSLSGLWQDKLITFLCLQKTPPKEIKAVVRNSCQISMSYSFSWFGNIRWPQQLAWLIPCWRELSNASTVPSKLKGQLKNKKHLLRKTLPSSK